MNGTEGHAIGPREGGGERVLKHPASRRVRAGLEERPETPPGIARTERGDRTGDRSRMMREVVDDGDAPPFGDDLLPALHAAKGRECRDDAVDRDTHGVGERDDTRGVGDVHRARQP